MINKAQEILNSTFGYSSFRPLQKEIIENILARKDSLAVMPTGSGKSICYQIPSVIFKGLTIVVSPLISLMTDQVAQLEEVGISAVCLNSSLDYRDYEENRSRIQNQDVNLLYVAPETLLLPKTIDLLQRVKIDCISIDEAHCISEWGHDFRPEYRQLKDIRSVFPDAVILALTATATARVQDDIMQCLGFAADRRFISSFDRENLFLRIIPKKQAKKQVLQLLQKFPGQSGIIYCFSRKSVEEITELLVENGYNAKPYHAGLQQDTRKQNQLDFIKDDVQIIVATIAFGMGINKSNVRFVIHYNLPKSIESYYQEIGRAGRDGLPAECILLFSAGDASKIRYFFDEKTEEQQKIANSQLQNLISYCESYQCRRKPLLKYFSEEYSKDNCGKCDNCLDNTREKVDLTRPAQMFLSCVKRTNEIFGMIYLIDVVRGSQSAKILSNNHHQLSTYGVGKEYSKKQWKSICNQLLQDKFLIKDHHGSLKLTADSWKLLKGQLPFWGFLEEDQENLNKIDTQKVVQSADQELYELLRKQRKKLADELNIPAFYIFTDRVLAQLAAQKPQNRQELLKVSGIGEVKAKNYGNIFLKIIHDYLGSQDNANIEEEIEKAREFHNKAKLSSKARQKEWTDQEDQLLISKFKEKQSLTKIANDFNRHSGEILSLLEQLGVI